MNRVRSGETLTMIGINVAFRGGLLSAFGAVVSVAVSYLVFLEHGQLIALAAAAAVGFTVFGVLWFLTVLLTMRSAFNEFGL